MKKNIWLLAVLLLLLFPSTVSAAKYKVVFCEQNGTVIKKQTVNKNGVIYAPKIPSKTGYENIGWSLIKGKTTPGKIVGASIRVKKNLTYYAIRKAEPHTITYYSNDGKRVIKKVKINEGKTYALSKKNPSGYTFMGWATTPKRTCDPKYEPKEKINVVRDMKLYEVLYSKKNEPDITPRTFYPNKKYDKVIFVGDSRTNLMSYTLQHKCSNKVKNVEFIAQNGTGISWFKRVAKPQLLNSIKSSKRTAVIFNHGVNDLKEKTAPVDWRAVANTYISYFNSLAKELKNCDLYYMSVNPVNCVHSPKRDENNIRNFNAKIKSGLIGYKYIDTYTYLVENGYTTGKWIATGNYKMETDGDDGVHYTMKTQKRIYDYCLKSILN